MKVPTTAIAALIGNALTYVTLHYGQTPWVAMAVGIASAIGVHVTHVNATKGASNLSSADNAWLNSLGNRVGALERIFTNATARNVADILKGNDVPKPIVTPPTIPTGDRPS